MSSSSQPVSQGSALSSNTFAISSTGAGNQTSLKSRRSRIEIPKLPFQPLQSHYDEWSHNRQASTTPTTTYHQNPQCPHERPRSSSHRQCNQRTWKNKPLNHGANPRTTTGGRKRKHPLEILQQHTKTQRANIEEAERGIAKIDLIYWQYIHRWVRSRPEDTTTVVLAKPTAVRDDHAKDESARAARGRWTRTRSHLFPSLSYLHPLACIFQRTYRYTLVQNQSSVSSTIFFLEMRRGRKVV